jgi:hypothetical protein
MRASRSWCNAYGDRLLLLGADCGESRESVLDFTGRYAISDPILVDPSLANCPRWSARVWAAASLFRRGVAWPA